MVRRKRYQLEYARHGAPDSDVVGKPKFSPITWVALIILAVCLLIVSLAYLNAASKITSGPPDPCFSNLHRIANAMFQYANHHNGNYPDGLGDLLSEGATAKDFICPFTSDVAVKGTLQQQMAMLSSGGHCSYLYFAKGMKMNFDASDEVLACDRLSNHAAARGAQVLFGDFHVEFRQDAQAMLNSFVPGQPLYWPPHPSPSPATQPSSGVQSFTN